MRRVRTRRRSGSAPRLVAPHVSTPPGSSLLVSTPPVSTPPGDVIPTVSGAEARAWCGPGHGLEWTLPHGATPEDVVQLATGVDGDRAYRLVLHPATLRPARDHQGRLVYLPVSRLPSNTGP